MFFCNDFYREFLILFLIIIPLMSVSGVETWCLVVSKKLE